MGQHVLRELARDPLWQFERPPVLQRGEAVVGVGPRSRFLGYFLSCERRRSFSDNILVRRPPRRQGDLHDSHRQRKASHFRLQGIIRFLAQTPCLQEHWRLWNCRKVLQSLLVSWPVDDQDSRHCYGKQSTKENWTSAKPDLQLSSQLCWVQGLRVLIQRCDQVLCRTLLRQRNWTSLQGIPCQPKAYEELKLKSLN